jgi:hypothetical protein
MFEEVADTGDALPFVAGTDGIMNLKGDYRQTGIGQDQKPLSNRYSLISMAGFQFLGSRFFGMVFPIFSSLNQTVIETAVSIQRSAFSKDKKCCFLSDSCQPTAESLIIFYPGDTPPNS